MWVLFLLLTSLPSPSFFFFLNNPPPPEISPLPLHDALPISFPLVNSRPPLQVGICFPNVAHIAALVPRTPSAKQNTDPATRQPRQHLSILNPDGQCVRWAPPNVVDLTSRGLNSLNRQSKSTHQIVDEEHIPDLLPVPIDHDRPPGDKRDHEVRQPALVLGSKLPGPINATHAENDGWKAVDARIVTDVVVCRAFRTPIRRVEVERLRLGDPVWKVAVFVVGVAIDHHGIFHAAVDLVGRRKDDNGLPTAQSDCLKDVQGPECVHLKIRMGILNGRGDGDLCGQMKHHIRITDDGLHRREVADISAHRSEPVIGMLLLKPGEVSFTPPANQAIKNRHNISVTQQVIDEIGANEAGSTSHNNTAWNHIASPCQRTVTLRSWQSLVTAPLRHACKLCYRTICMYSKNLKSVTTPAR